MGAILRPTNCLQRSKKMASISSSTFTGAKLAVKSTAARRRVSCKARVVTVQAVNSTFIQQLQKKKVFSTIEQIKLLSAAEKAGISLSTVEDLGLLSVGEKLGLFSFAEKAVTNPGTLTITAIPLLLAAAAIVVTVLDDTTLELVGQYGAAGLLVATSLALLTAKSAIGKMEASSVVSNEGSTFIQQLQKKKGFSKIEQSGLLSATEKAGISLSKVEDLGLLSVGEKFGLFSFAEKVVTNPGTLTITAIPLLLAAAAIVVTVPDDTTLELVGQYGAAGLLAATSLALLAAQSAIGKIYSEDKTAGRKAGGKGKIEETSLISNLPEEAQGLNWSLNNYTSPYQGPLKPESSGRWLE